MKSLRYRGHGCPGATHIEAKDGRIFEQTYDETWSDELSQDLQFRCKICPDSTGEQADIVCGDAWIGLDGYAHVEHEGWNSIIARTETGERLLREMEAGGAIVTVPIGVDDLNRMQPHQVERKTAVLARILGLGLRGQPIPEYRGLRLLRNAWSGRGQFFGTLAGTFRRVGSRRKSGGPPAREARSRHLPAPRPGAQSAGREWRLPAPTCNWLRPCR